DRDAIGREKAGIMRPGRPVVVGDADPPQSLGAHAAEIGARMLAIGRDFRAVPHAHAWRFEAESGRTHDALPFVPFGGGVQMSNMAACVAVVGALDDELPV